MMMMMNMNSLSAPIYVCSESKPSQQNFPDIGNCLSTNIKCAKIFCFYFVHDKCHSMGLHQLLHVTSCTLPSHSHILVVI